MDRIDYRKKEIFREYQAKRENALLDAENKKVALYNKYPRLKEIEDEISNVGISIAKKVMHKELSKEEGIKECDKRMSTLTEEKNNIYIENGIPKNYLEPKYECIYCGDTGLLKDGSKCRCYKRQLVKEVYELSNMDVLLEYQNFKKLDMNVYSKVANKDGKVQKEIMLENIKIAKKFIKNIDDRSEKSLLFYGPTGSGKTFLSSCIAKEVIENGKTVIYTTISEMMDLARNYNFGEINKEIIEKYKLMADCDLLIIDDLGTELTNKFVMVEMYKTINNRMINGKKVIISTNLSLDKIYENYSGRIFYRMVEGYRMLEFVGPNLRISKLD